MFVALIAGAIIGFVLAMPPGPIAMASVRMGLEKSTRDAFQMSMGTAFMDMIYCVLAMFTASAINSSIGIFLDNNPIITITFQSLIVSALLFFGIKQFKKNTIKETIQSESQLSSNTFIKNLKSKGPLMLGLALSLTNIANPTFLPTLTVLTTWVQKLELFTLGFNNNILFAIGFGIGNFLWLYLLSSVVKANKHRISDNYIYRIRQFAGLTFIGFGGIIGWRMVTFTNWSNIAKLIFVF